MLKARVEAGDADAGGFVHWGATSLDVIDTAMVLLLRRCRDILIAIASVCLPRYAVFPMSTPKPLCSPTLLQPASPVTFGLRSAGWYAGVHRGWQRVWSRFDGALLLFNSEAQAARSPLSATRDSK